MRTAIFLGLAWAAGCAAGRAGARPGAGSPPAPEGPLQVRADPRVDLMGLLQALARRGPVDAGARASYGERGLRRFLPLRDHAAVRRLRRMEASGFAGNIPCQLALHLSDPPELREIVPAGDLFAGAAGGRAELEGFLSDARAFARETAFADWWRSQRPAIQELEARLRQAVGPVDLEGLLEDYLGVRTWRRLQAVPSPFYPRHWGGSWVLEEGSALPDVFVVVGVGRGRAGEPVYGDPKEMARKIWPEVVFSAAYLMVEMCRPMLRPGRGACQPQWRPQGAEGCLERLWVDGILSRLMELQFHWDVSLYGKASPYFPRVLEALRRFEERRREFGDLVAYTPALLEAVQDVPAPACHPPEEVPPQDALHAVRVERYLGARLKRAAER